MPYYVDDEKWVLIIFMQSIHIFEEIMTFLIKKILGENWKEEVRKCLTDNMVHK
jgi:hypothetical protein